MTKNKTERILALIAFLTIVLAGLLGILKKAEDYETEIALLLDDGEHMQLKGEGLYLITGRNSEDLRAYITVSGAEGYGGELRTAIRMDTLGSISDLLIISHNETPSFLKKVLNKGLVRQIKGKGYAAFLDSNQGIDVVSGATYTSAAIIECGKAGSRRIAKEELGIEVPAEARARFTVGIPELTLVVLYLVALIGIYTRFPYKKVLRWTTLIAGLIVLGFWFSVPLTLSRINLFLLGFWPDWHDHLYWYILVFGFFLILLVTRKNIYCSWICPLACIQDGLGAIGGARPRFSRKVNQTLKWVQRFVAWLAIILALYYRNPVELNYEIFGVSLSLTGVTYLFIMTGVFFIASVFIKRPWCNYLCPVSPVADLVSLLSGRLKKLLFR